MFDVNDLKKKVEEKGEELKEKSAEHLENLKEKSAEHIDTLKKAIEENQDDWKEKSAEHLENLKENVSSNWREIFFGSWKKILAVGLCLIGLWSFFTSSEVTSEDRQRAEIYAKRGSGNYFDSMIMQRPIDKLDLLDQSIEDYTRAIEIDPKNSDYYAGRGVAYEARSKINNRIKDYDNAIDDFEKAIDLNPNHPLAKQFLKDMPHR